MMQVHSSGRSHVGQVRNANEDALHVGDSVFAVADGMGGHLAGEVASSTALEPISQLDGRVFPDAAAARSALRDAVVGANEAVVAKAADDPAFQGMGTTLTAVMIEGRRAHIAHVGDSRAYLFRGGRFSQLTTDHTLVQRMIDEGRLTREEAARHPQRSVITRAIGVEASIDVDAMSLDLEPGDVVLLCSDGLTGPVDDDAIETLLAATAEASESEADDTPERVERVATALVDAANEAGGPDNITVIVLEFDELPTAPAPRRPAPAAEPLRVTTAPDVHQDDWAGRLGRLGTLGGNRGVPTQHDDDLRIRRGVTPGQRIAAIVIAVGLIIGAVFAGGRWVLSRSYYVGLAGDQVVIFQGVPAEFGPFDLSWELEPTDLTVDELPPLEVRQLRDGVPATSAEDARTLVENYRRLADDEAG